MFSTHVHYYHFFKKVKNIIFFIGYLNNIILFDTTQKLTKMITYLIELPTFSTQLKEFFGLKARFSFFSVSHLPHFEY